MFRHGNYRPQLYQCMHITILLAYQHTHNHVMLKYNILYGLYALISFSIIVLPVVMYESTKQKNVCLSHTTFLL